MIASDSTDAHEEQLIGAVMLSPAVADDVSFIATTMFGNEQFGTLWPHLMLEAQQRRTFDLALFIARLKTEGDFDKAGGLAVIAKAAESVVSAAHAVYHAHEVRKAAQRRQLIATAKKIIADASDLEQEVDTIIAKSETALRAVEDMGATATFVMAAEAAEAAVEAARAARNNPAQHGITTGISDHDNNFGGFQAGELIVIAARPGNGKTSFAMQAIVNACHGGHTGLAVTLEMGAAELAMRELAGDCAIDSRIVRNGTTTDDELLRLSEAAGNWKYLPLAILDAPRTSVAEIRRSAKALKRTYGLAVLTVDYLGLLSPTDVRQPRHEQIGAMTRELKQIARDLQVPILLLAQLNRQSDQSRDGKPKLSHLRESGAIEQDADRVLFIHRSDKTPEDQPTTTLIVAKNRNGPTGEVELFFDTARTRFTGVEKRFAAFDGYNSTPFGEHE